MEREHPILEKPIHEEFFDAKKDEAKHENLDGVKDEEDGEDAFFTPPESPHDQPDFLRHGFKLLRPNTNDEVLPRHGELHVEPPPSQPAPLRFTFKAQRDSEPAGPPAPLPPSPQVPKPPPKHERRHRPNEAEAIPQGPAHRLPPLLDDPGLIFDVEWSAWYEKCPKWKTAWEKIQTEWD